jgi:hypothetical protein
VRLSVDRTNSEDVHDLAGPLHIGRRFSTVAAVVLVLLAGGVGYLGAQQRQVEPHPWSITKDDSSGERAFLRLFKSVPMRDIR